jgi:hypothetical protein
VCLSSIIVDFAQEKVQIKLTEPSPSAFEQEIGSTIIKVAYNRPLSRGRKIFGELIPLTNYGERAQVQYSRQPMKQLILATQH